MSDKNLLIERAARAGYLTKGVLYIIVGVLSVHAAWQGGRASGSEDAARTAASAPFGTVLVALISAGLFGYAAWKAIQGIYDTERKGTGWKGWAMRLAYGISALIHLGLAWTCARLAMGESSSGGGGGGGLWLDRLLASDAGPVLLVVAGCLVGIFGGVQLYSAYSGRYCKPLNMHEASRGERHFIDISGKVGYAARGLVFLVVGYTLVRSGLEEHGWFQKGVEGALNEIASSSAGPVGLALVSAGLFLYGGFLIAAARYRRVSSERVDLPDFATR